MTPDRDTLIKDHWHLVKRELYYWMTRSGKNQSTLMDVESDAAACLLRAAETWDGRGEFSGYAALMIRRGVIDGLRHRTGKSESSVLRALHLAESLDAAREDADGFVVPRGEQLPARPGHSHPDPELWDQVERCLTPLQARIVRLLLIDGLDQTEAARVIGVASQNVQYHWKRSLGLLRDHPAMQAWRPEGAMA